MNEMLTPGTLFAGKYSVSTLLQHTAFETIARATNAWGDPVLLELFTPPGLATPTGQRARQAFLRYARQLSQVQHPGVMRVVDIIDDPNGLAVVFEDRLHTSLRENITRGALSSTRLAELTRQLYSALAAVHAQNSLQIQLSPDTIWFDQQETPLLGFPGLAQRALQDIGLTSSTDERYQAPEVQAGGSFSPQADLYALGAALHETATRRTPTPVGARLQGVPLMVLPEDTSPAVRQALDLALALDPARRAMSAREVLEAMARAQVEDPPPVLPEPVVEPAPPSVPLPAEPPAVTRRSMPVTTGIMLTLGGLIVLGFGAFALRGANARPAEPQLIAAEATPAAPETPAEAAPIPAADPEPSPTEAPVAAAVPPEPPPVLRTEIVTAGHLNLRQTADNSSAVQTVLNRGTRLDVISESESWLQVRTGGLEGWVNADHTVPLIEGEAAQTALAQLQAGGDVVLPAGAYWLETPLTLSTDTQVTGAGIGETLLLSSAPEDTLILENASIALNNLSVVHVGSQPARVVYQTGGELSTDHAAFLGGVRDEDESAFGSGLWIAENGTATLKNSDFEDNAFGLYVSDNGVANATASTFNGNSLGGALYKDNASGAINNSTFNANGVHGLHVFGQASPALTSDRFVGNKGRGVTIYDEATPELTGNTIEENKLQGVGVQDTAKPTLTGNTIQGNKQSGLTYFDNAAGEASHNTIQGNAVSGITVTAYASPTLTSNTVDRNRANGIAYSDFSAGEAEANTVSSNGSPGISAWGDAQPHISNNTVSGNHQSGVVIAERARPSVSGNHIFNNTLFGLIVTDTAQPQVTDNTVSANGKGGIFYKRQAGGEGAGNTCTDNQGSDFSTALDPENTSLDFSPDDCPEN